MSFSDHFAHDLARLIVDFPFAIFTIGGLARWIGLYECFDLPTPTWKQAFGISLLLFGTVL